jgi:hypothetical protein
MAGSGTAYAPAGRRLTSTAPVGTALVRPLGAGRDQAAAVVINGT